MILKLQTATLFSKPNSVLNQIVLLLFLLLLLQFQSDSLVICVPLILIF